jgi:hypothetical protein
MPYNHALVCQRLIGMFVSKGFTFFNDFLVKRNPRAANDYLSAVIRGG